MKKVTRTFGNIPTATVSMYAEYADGAEDILFVHMSWGNAALFDYYSEFFAEHGYNCHAIDLRGHGKSGGDVANTTMADYVTDVQTAVEGLRLANPILVGHSMGGLVALMYAREFATSAVISIDGSPTIEVQKVSTKQSYPKKYKPTDVGMPQNLFAAARAFPDISFMDFLKIRLLLGVESGIARTERKRGISVPREELSVPLLFIGAEDGSSVPFGIGIEVARAQGQYYRAPVVRIKDATHLGILIGDNWRAAAEAILTWFHQNKL